jgi:hypothetical protein
VTHGGTKENGPHSRIKAASGPFSQVLAEQHAQAAQEHGIDVKGLRSEDRLGLPGQERPPSQASPPGCGTDACILEDFPHRRRRDLMAEAGQLAVDVRVV